MGTNSPGSIPPMLQGEGRVGEARAIIGLPDRFTSRPHDRGESADNSERNFREGLPSLGLNRSPASERENQDQSCAARFHAEEHGAEAFARGQKSVASEASCV